MLTSITPLGERSRGFSWRVTAGAFGLGSLLAGLLAGGAAGGVGSLLPDGNWRRFALLGVLLAAICFDATALRSRLPSIRRQVNEDWLGRYRGWVYGAAFGVQLGVGVATIVTTAAIYAAAFGALLSGAILTGALAGAAFGATRAASLLPARIATDSAGLARLHRSVSSLEPRARRLVVAAEATAIALLIGAVL